MGADIAAHFIREPNIPSVLVLTHSYHGNGAAEMLLFLARWFALEKGWQLHALSRGLTDKDISALRDAGVGLVDAIHPEQYDFAIVNTVVSGPAYIEELAGQLPALLWVHEGEFFLWNSAWTVRDCKRIFATCRHIVFQSTWQAERIFGSFTSTLPTTRYSIVPNCLPTIPQEGISPHPRSYGKKRIIFIGSLYDRKRPTDLVEAVLRLNRQDVECVFVGSTDFLHTFSVRHQSILRDDPRFVLTGEISRKVVTTYLASSDVLSLPSADESQPLVLLEAAHFNVPVVISNLPVYKDLWTDGINCLMHPVGDVDMLAGHLTTCLSGDGPLPVLPRERQGGAAEPFLNEFHDICRGLLPVRFGGRM